MQYLQCAYEICENWYFLFFSGDQHYVIESAQLFRGQKPRCVNHVCLTQQLCGLVDLPSTPLSFHFSSGIWES